MRINQKTPLSRMLELGKQPLCGRMKKCELCCAFNSAFVIESDIKKLAEHFTISEERFREEYCTKNFLNEKKEVHKLKTRNIGKPYGPCIFFEPAKGCKLHSIKPLHCRISNCNENGAQLHNWFMKKHIHNMQQHAR